MQPTISPEEAARTLAAIEASRAAMRSAVRSHRGHLHLWWWGLIWIAMASLAQTLGLAGIKLFPWLTLLGTVGSFVIGWLQATQIRGPIDRRYLRVVAVTLAFGLVLGPVLGLPRSPESVFAYIGLLVAQVYVISGLWFDNYLLKLGLIIAAAMLVGVLFLGSWFWIWVGVVGGGTLLISGSYVRYRMD